MRKMVQEMMSTPVLTTTPLTKAVDAALVIALHDITALPVVRDVRLVGMFSEEDLLSAEPSSGQSAMHVCDVMGAARLRTTPQSDVDELAEEMLR